MTRICYVVAMSIIVQAVMIGALYVINWASSVGMSYEGEPIPTRLKAGVGEEELARYFASSLLWTPYPGSFRSIILGQPVRIRVRAQEKALMLANLLNLELMDDMSHAVLISLLMFPTSSHLASNSMEMILLPNET